MHAIRAVSVAKETVDNFLTNNCTYIAAAIAFYAFFSLFPIALGLVSTAGFILGDGSLDRKLAEHIGSLLPVSNEFITSTIQGIIQAKGVTGVAATIGLLWSASTVFGAIRKGVNAAWGIRKPRPFLLERLIDVSLMVGAGLLFLLSLSSTVVLQFSRDLSLLINSQSPMNEGMFWRYFTLILPPVLTFIIFMSLYRFLPNTKVRWGDVWLGAILATISFEIMKNVFVWYVKQFTPYNIIYGPLGALVAFLTWVYVSAVIFLFGAQISSTFSRLTTANKERVKVIPATRRWGKTQDMEAEEDD